MNRRQTHELSPRRRWAALASLMLVVLLVSVDNTVMTFAIPAISRDLNPTGTQLLWMVDAYPLVLAGLLIPMGALADRFGRRRLLFIGVIGFAIVSACAAWSPNGAMLVAARAGIGFFGAMLMPSTLSLIRNIFTDRQERRTAIAIWAAGFASGAAIGPIVGGFLLEHFWWGSVFLMAVPVLALFVATASFLLPESKDPEATPIDLPSSIFVLATMVFLALGIKGFAKSDLSPMIAVYFLAGIALGFVFVRRQLRVKNPMLDLRLFTIPAFSVSVFINMLSMFSLIGFMLFAAQDLQLIHSLSPMIAGVALLPGAITMTVFGLGAVPALRRFAPRTVILAGLALMITGYLIMAVVPYVSVAVIVTANAVLAAGIGLAETVSNDLILSTAPANKAGAASAISETAYEFGTLLGAALLGTILTATYVRNVSVPADLTDGQAAAASETLGGAVSVAETLPADAATSLLDSANSAFASGVVFTSIITVVVLAAAAVLCFFTLKDVEA